MTKPMMAISSKQLRATALLSAIALSALMAAPTFARPGNGNGQGNRPASTPQATSAPQTAQPTPTASQLTDQQRQALISMILGTSSNSTLIDPALRAEILANRASLPPGIQRRLVRGRGLPPGIAKRFNLPSTVPPAVNLPPNCQIVVVGSNVVVLDPVTSLIVDVLLNVL
ncbi:MAG TPA: hypothetical protein V6D06_05540 [Trichocoleus sp.]